MDTAQVELIPQVIAFGGVRMHRQQVGEVVRGRPIVVPRRHADRAEARRERSPSWVVSTTNGTTPGASTVAVTPMGVSSSSSSGRSKRMSRISDASPSTVLGHGQRHLAVGGPRQGGRTVDLVIGQPGQRLGTDLTLPNVPFRLLGQPHVCAHQGDAPEP